MCHFEHDLNSWKRVPVFSFHLAAYSDRFMLGPDIIHTTGSPYAPVTL